MLGGHGGVESAYESRADRTAERNVAESAYGSAASTLESKDSTATINSRTGLIPSPSVVQPAYSGGPGQLSGSMSGGGDAMEGITKTRRRIKDPYAIDLSDEDEDEDDDEDEDQLTALPTPTGNQPERQLQQPAQRQTAPRQREESLMDFLNGMDPPGGASSAKPQPFLLSEETIAAAKARAAAGQNGSNSSNLTASRNGNGTAPPFGSASSSSSTNKPRLQARAPAVADGRSGMGGMGGGSRTATSDLADFLKNSGPPEPVVQTRREEVPEKKKRFWQRGKSSGKTYGDLP